MVLMVSSVQVDVTWVDEQECKQDDEDLDRILASIYKVSIKHVGLLQGWHSILQTPIMKHIHFVIKSDINVASGGVACCFFSVFCLRFYIISEISGSF